MKNILIFTWNVELANKDNKHHEFPRVFYGFRYTSSTEK